MSGKRAFAVVKQNARIERKISMALDAFAKRQARDSRRLRAAVAALRSGVREGESRAVMGTKLSRVLDVEYGISGECDLFGNLADYMLKAKLVERDFDERAHGFKRGR